MSSGTLGKEVVGVHSPERLSPTIEATNQCTPRYVCERIGFD